MANDSEIQRLQERVADLERQLRRRPPSERRYSYRDDVMDVSQSKLDEIASLFRGVVRAGVEGLRTAADSASQFSEDVLDGNAPAEGDTPRDTIRRLPGDLVSAYTRAIDGALDAPRRAADQLTNTYRSQPRRHHVHRHSEDENYSDWTTSELRKEARYYGISGYDDMSRTELLAALALEPEVAAPSASRTRSAAGSTTGSEASPTK